MVAIVAVWCSHKAGGACLLFRVEVIDIFPNAALLFLFLKCSMLAEDAIHAAIKDLQDKGAVPKPAQHAEAA